MDFSSSQGSKGNRGSIGTSLSPTMEANRDTRDNTHQVVDEEVEDMTEYSSVSMWRVLHFSMYLTICRKNASITDGVSMPTMIGGYNTASL